ncbi:MAG: hypothetical protein WBV46_07695 [Terriglobales bacterium]|jgi:hypothetical protein
MTSKVGNWMIAIGCFVAFAGLCTLPAAFGAQRDTALLSAGAMLFSTGMVLAASGFYMKARYLVESEPSKNRTSGKGHRKVCDICANSESAIECRVHHLHICPDCLGKHYDFKSCAYVPAPRQTYARAKAQAQASGA